MGLLVRRPGPQYGMRGSSVGRPRRQRLSRDKTESTPTGGRNRDNPGHRALRDDLVRVTFKLRVQQQPATEYLFDDSSRCP